MGLFTKMRPPFTCLRKLSRGELDRASLKKMCEKLWTLSENGGNGQRAGSVLHLINIGKIYFKISMLIKKERKMAASL